MASKKEIREFAKEILNRPTYTPGRTDVGEFRQALEYLLELTRMKVISRIIDFLFGAKLPCSCGYRVRAKAGKHVTCRYCGRTYLRGKFE